MPPRKRRGRAKKASGGDRGSKKQALKEFREEVQEVEPEVPETEAVDPELLQAQSTIERLARKYLNKSFEVSSHSLDIVRGDSMIVKEPEEDEAMEILSEDSSTAEGEEEKENRFDESLTNSSSETPQAARKRKVTQMRDSSVVLRRVRDPRAMKKTKLDNIKQERSRKAPFSSPDFKLPQPTLGHSTPGDIGISSLPPQRRNSLFGFETLESPLVLSPVQSMSFLADQDADETADHNRSLLEDGKKHKPSSVKKLLGTYDIPLKKPTPRNRKRHTKQKNKRSSVAEDEWIKKLASEFSEVDNFELAIE